MKIERALDYDDMSRRAARDIVREVRSKPDLLLGVATGDSPTGTYEALARERARGRMVFGGIRVLALDEWLGLPSRHPVACETYVRDRILRPLGISSSHYQGFRSRAPNRQAECRRVASWLERHGPIDLCILGLGRNGHLLMNEPAERFEPGAHVARLAPSTRHHPNLKAAGVSPRFGYTLGLADVLQAKRILLLVSGRHKATPLKRMLEGRVTTECPASFLWLHADVTVICDRAARP